MKGMQIGEQALKKNRAFFVNVFLRPLGIARAR
jgi:hypothetical protein